MPISDRLDEIESVAQRAAECWPVGRSKFNTESNAAVIDDALENGDLLLAALRAVLGACDELGANIPYDNGNATANHAGRTIRRAIAAALGEDTP